MVRIVPDPRPWDARDTMPRELGEPSNAEVDRILAGLPEASRDSFVGKTSSIREAPYSAKARPNHYRQV
jgi:hypothetical protein